MPAPPGGAGGSGSPHTLPGAPGLGATGGAHDDRATCMDDLSTLTKVKKSLAYLINSEDEETTTELIRKKVKKTKIT